MAESGGSPFGDFDERLRRLKAERAVEPEPEAPSGERQLRLGDGLQVGIELVAGVAGGLLVGWLLDRWLGTAPLFLLLLFVLGSIAGTLNAYRWLKRWGAQEPGEGTGRSDRR
jgi:ATP synthase protein I